MSNVRSVDEAKRRLDEMAAEFSGKKPDLSVEDRIGNENKS